MKKILTTILAAVFGLGAWADPVAKVGTTEYETIDEAIAVWTSGTTLTLLADYTVEDGVTFGVPEDATLSIEDGVHLYVLGILQNNGEIIGGSNALEVRTMVYDTLDVRNYEDGSSWTVKATLAGKYQGAGTISDGALVYKISINGGASWIVDENNGTTVAYVPNGTATASGNVAAGSKFLLNDDMSAVFGNLKTLGNKSIYILKNIDLMANTDSYSAALYLYSARNVVIYGNGNTIKLVGNNGSSSSFDMVKIAGSQFEMSMYDLTLDNNTVGTSVIEIMKKGYVSNFVKLYNVVLKNPKNSYYKGIKYTDSDSTTAQWELKLYDCEMPSFSGPYKALARIYGDKTVIQSLSNLKKDNTTIYGGRFGTAPSTSLAEGKSVYVDDENYYVVGSLDNYGGTVTSGSSVINYKTANAAIKNGSGKTITIFESADVSASLSSGTTTLIIESGASYTGNVTLSGTSGTFIVKFREDVGYYGNVTATRSGYRISLSETEADGIVTRTYTVQGNTAITEANAEAAIVSDNGSTTNYYGSVYDAFYAVDGNTEGKTIVLLKDASNARILTNGKAVDGVGKTVATFDLNGHKFTLQGADTGNDADYTLTVIDSSEEGTGEVMNTTFSLLKIALTGTGDYSGKYTMKVQGGTWHFNPSAVVYDGNTYDLVDEGYIAVDNGNGTWTVGKFLIETGDLHTDTVIGDDTTEAVYTISTTVKVGNTVVSTTDSQTINVSVPSDKDIGGTTLHSVNLDSLVEAAVDSAGVDAASVSKVEIFVSAVEVSEADGTITYEVKPEMIVTVTKGGVSTESEIELTNEDLASGATFTFPLDVTALDVQVGGWVKVKHMSKDPAYDDETMYLQAVQSANLFGAVKITGNVASNMYVAVPFEGFESAGAARKAKDVVHPANLTAETKMYVYNKTSDSHDVYKVASGAWAPAVKVTINSNNAATLDAASLDRAVPAGTGVLVARANAGDNVYVYGQIPGAAVNPEPFAKGQTFVAPPYTNATVEVSGVKYINLNTFTWTGVSAARQNRKLVSGADFIQFRDANNRLIKFYYDGTSWGLQPTYAKLAAYKPYVEGGRALVPQGTAFWYCSSVGGAKVEWTK